MTHNDLYDYLDECELDGVHAAVALRGPEWPSRGGVVVSASGFLAKVRWNDTREFAWIDCRYIRTPEHPNERP